MNRKAKIKELRQEVHSLQREHINLANEVREIDSITENGLLRLGEHVETLEEQIKDFERDNYINTPSSMTKVMATSYIRDILSKLEALRKFLDIHFETQPSKTVAVENEKRSINLVEKK